MDWSGRIRPKGPNWTKITEAGQIGLNDQSRPNWTEVDWNGSKYYTDVAQQEHNNNKYYTSTFRNYIDYPV